MVCDDKRKVIAYLWYLNALLSIAYVIAAIAFAARNNVAASGSKAAGFAAIWSMLILLIIIIFGTLVMRRVSQVMFTLYYALSTHKAIPSLRNLTWSFCIAFFPPLPQIMKTHFFLNNKIYFFLTILKIIAFLEIGVTVQDPTGCRRLPRALHHVLADGAPVVCYFRRLVPERHTPSRGSIRQGFGCLLLLLSPPLCCLLCSPLLF